MSGTPPDRLAAALQQASASDRLQAALTAGTRPDPGFLEPLVARCAIEPDFFVRDMLTWALTRFRVDEVLPRVIAELGSTIPQARSQALHTLSKLADPRGWPAITADHLHDPDDEVARSAWRAAASLVPFDERDALAGALAAELGRGDLEVQRSLSRALLELGDAGESAAARAERAAGEPVRAHARATLRLFEDPDAAFFLEAGGPEEA